jgi:hypothetical protein
LNKIIKGDKKHKLIPLILDELKDEDIPLLLGDIKYVRLSDKKEYKKLLLFLKQEI